MSIKLTLPEAVPVPRRRLDVGDDFLMRAAAAYWGMSFKEVADPFRDIGKFDRTDARAVAEAMAGSDKEAAINKLRQWHGFVESNGDVERIAEVAFRAGHEDWFLDVAATWPCLLRGYGAMLLVAMANHENELLEKTIANMDRLSKERAQSGLSGLNADELLVLFCGQHTKTAVAREKKGVYAAAINNLEGWRKVFQHIHKRDPQAFRKLQMRLAQRDEVALTAVSALVQPVDDEHFMEEAVKEKNGTRSRGPLSWIMSDIEKQRQELSAWLTEGGALPTTAILLSGARPIPQAQEIARCDFLDEEHDTPYLAMLLFGTAEGFAHYLLRWCSGIGEHWTQPLLRAAGVDEAIEMSTLFTMLAQANFDVLQWRAWGDVLLALGPDRVAYDMLSPETNDMDVLPRLEEEAKTIIARRRGLLPRGVT